MAVKGKTNNPHGRPKGAKNKTTLAVREVIAKFADDLAPDFVEWVKETAAMGDPAKAADLYLKAIEYHIPKLSRAELTGKDGADLTPAVVVLPSKNETNKD